MSKNKNTLHSHLFTLVIAAALALGGALFVGCGDDDGDDPQIEDFECQEGRDGWEQCKDNKVQYCHIFESMPPHFHWGADCQSLGLTCVEHGSNEATCVDESKSCTASDVTCESNTAYNCIDGRLGQEPCGTSKECTVSGGKATCEDKSSECSGHGKLVDGACQCDTDYKQDPADKTKCIPEKDFPTLACEYFKKTAKSETPVTAFKDFPNAHADLEQPYEVTLPDGQESYVHFPVTETGEYVVFVSEAGAFDTFMHRTETVVTPAGGVANGKCSDLIKDHWHADLTFDGGTGDTKVPYIIKFKAVTGGQKLTFMVMHKHTH